LIEWEPRRTMNRMLPIAIINSHHLTRRATIGARADDPVVPERPRRLGRRRRAAAAQAPRGAQAGASAPALTPRGTS
jgi:hypothetical protein